MQLREKVGVGSGVERKHWEGESKQEGNTEQECGIEHKEQKRELECLRVQSAGERGREGRGGIEKESGRVGKERESRRVRELQ